MKFCCIDLLLGVFCFGIGASLGSFFKLVVDRYNTEESFVFKPSYCFNCKNKLLWWHNVPIFSYLALGRKCFFCKSKLDVNLFISELFSALLASSIFYFSRIKNYSIFGGVSLLIFIMILFLLSMFDLKHRIVPHSMTYAAIIFVVFAKSILHEPLLNVFLSLGLAFLFMDLLYMIATSIKKYKCEPNYICLPLLIWSFYFLFYKSIYFLFLPIFVFFIFYFLKPLQMVLEKISGVCWMLLIGSLTILIFKSIFIELTFSRLSVFFAGVGIIYFICEAMFYFYHYYFVSKDDNWVLDQGYQNLVIGGGDITVFALISTFIGYKFAFLTLFTASLFALISHFIIRILGRKYIGVFQGPDIKYVPFVPYLSFACFIIIIILYA